MSIPSSFIDQILDQADIVDIVGRRIQLNKKGQNFWCLCPFHDDKKPSMAVNQDKQFFYCFVCNASGNSIHFLRRYENLDFVDAIDNYGLTKGKGEVQSQNTLTIRSSMIGRELFNKTELLEWLISEKGKSVKGFSQVIYSGVTNLYMANLIKELIIEGIQINGIYNISSPPISKYDLLNKLNRVFNLDLKIEKDNSKKSDKSLKSNKFFSKYYYHKPNWDDMINELFHDSEKFHELYKN